MTRGLHDPSRRSQYGIEEAPKTSDRPALSRRRANHALVPDGCPVVRRELRRWLACVHGVLFGAAAA